MSRFYNVRGFFDCGWEDLETIRNVVSRYAGVGDKYGLDAATAELYLGGWIFQELEINWIAHTFFGASMRLPGVDMMFDVVTDVSRSVLEIDGLFLVDDDEGEVSRRWLISDGKFSVEDRQVP